MISLGYEVGTGEEVSVPLGHTIVTGQSQKSGKTTALEAMAVRCFGNGTSDPDPSIIAFVTKRGERSFLPGNGIGMAFTMSPYFVERADWRFVAATLESAFGEKMRFERAWIVRACKGARSLSDVRETASHLMEKSKRSMDRDIYMLLGEYLDEVLPDIRELPASSSTFLVGRGVNTMNLVEWRPKMQMLFIASTLSKVARDQENTVVIVPESWETLPERRNTPVKEPAVEIARKGAAVGNYLWVDSQDTAAVSKEIIRQSTVWLLGVQRESNEIRRTLAHIPAGLKKPKADDVARLELGQFFACTPDGVTKTYVRPAWMEADAAKQVAMGKFNADVMASNHRQSVEADLKKTVVYQHKVSSLYGKFGRGGDVVPVRVPGRGPDIEDVVTSLVAGLRNELIKRLDEQQCQISQLSEHTGMLMRGDWPVMLPPSVPFPTSEMRERAEARVKPKAITRLTKSLHPFDTAFAHESLTPAPKHDTKGWSTVEEELYQKFKARFIAELRKEAPEIVRVFAMKPELEVAVERRTVSMNGDSLRGRIALLVHGKFFDEPKEDKAILKELYRRGGTVGDARNYKRELGWLAENGFLTVEDNGYLAVKSMKVNVKEGARS